MEKSAKSDIAIARFNGKNYATWALQFQLYLKGKELWEYIDGFEKTPVEDAKKILSWKTKDAKIKTWILGSISF